MTLRDIAQVTLIVAGCTCLLVVSARDADHPGRQFSHRPGSGDESRANNAKIRRSATQLPDGIKTVTESDDPKIAQDIKAHVASMSGRLKDGKEFNIFSTTLPVIFDNAKSIKSVVEMTDKGAIVTRTSTDAKVVAALQAHAGEVTELVQEGTTAFHRGLNSRMAMGPGGPRGAMGAGNSSNKPQPQTTQ